MNDKIKKLSEDYVTRINNKFKDKDVIVVLYGSSVEGNVSSDFDVCTFLHSYSEEDAKKIGDITKQFHIDNKLKLDNEVPFESKTIYSFFDIERMLLKPPFPVFRNEFYITPIEKNEEFLSSDDIKLRLLLFVLTANSVVIGGNEQIFNSYRERAWETLIRVIYSYLGNPYLSVDEFVKNISENYFNGDRGKDFLGYREEKEIQHNYLLNKTEEYFKKFYKEGKMLKNNNSYKCETLWVNELKNSALSNNFKNYNIELKEYQKMGGNDFSENANPFGPSRKVEDALRMCSKYLNVYSDYKNIDINNDLSEFLQVPVENVAICNGSLEAIYAIPRILDSSKTTIVVPTYWGYEAGLKTIDKECNKVQLTDDFEFDLEKINEAAKDSTMMFICNPNNPTSSYIFKKDIYEIVKNNPNCHFVIDESHMLLHDDYLEETMNCEVETLGNITTVYSLSKLFSVAGLRVGAVVSSASTIEKFKKWQVPYSLNTVAQVIFPICLKDKEFVEYTRKNISKLVEELSNDLRQFDWLEVKESKTNFVMCRIKDRITAVELANKLQEDKIYIRELTTSYPEVNGEYIRISVNKRELNKLLIETIKKYNI
ncbi:MAG: histidinol-phosphate aminotransferase family protein [Clostridiales bacterium]|nr:histidinol-phosphate aminotransferase family protein [Clostridiales bacterium]